MTLQELLDKVEKLDREATSGAWMAGYDDWEVDDWKVRQKKTGCRIGEMDAQLDNQFVAQSRQFLPLLARIVKALTTDERFDDHDVLAMIETAECIINEENAI
jgi:hypothetical protein